MFRLAPLLVIPFLLGACFGDPDAGSSDTQNVAVTSQALAAKAESFGVDGVSDEPALEAVDDPAADVQQRDDDGGNPLNDCMRRCDVVYFHCARGYPTRENECFAVWGRCIKKCDKTIDRTGGPDTHHDTVEESYDRPQSVDKAGEPTSSSELAP